MAVAAVRLVAPTGLDRATRQILGAEYEMSVRPVGADGAVIVTRHTRGVEAVTMRVDRQALGWPVSREETLETSNVVTEICIFAPVDRIGPPLDQTQRFVPGHLIPRAGTQSRPSAVRTTGLGIPRRKNSTPTDPSANTMALIRKARENPETEAAALETPSAICPSRCCRAMVR